MGCCSCCTGVHLEISWRLVAFMITMVFMSAIPKTRQERSWRISDKVEFQHQKCLCSEARVLPVTGSTWCHCKRRAFQGGSDGVPTSSTTRRRLSCPMYATNLPTSFRHSWTVWAGSAVTSVKQNFPRPSVLRRYVCMLPLGLGTQTPDSQCRFSFALTLVTRCRTPDRRACCDRHSCLHHMLHCLGRSKCSELEQRIRTCVYTQPTLRSPSLIGRPAL